MVKYIVTVEVDGKWSRNSVGNGDGVEHLISLANPEQHKKDMAAAAHILLCNAVGLALASGLDVDEFLSLKNHLTFSKPEIKSTL